MSIIGNTSFKEFISLEMYQASPELSFEVKEYISDLLYQYLFSEALFDQKSNGKSYKSTLAEIYSKTYEAKPQQRIYLFKKIGDLSLCLSGFFRSSLKQKLVHVSYYKDMGKLAYSYLADHYDDRENVFSSLSGHFDPLSEILFAIQKKSESQYQDQHYLLKSCKKA